MHRLLLALAALAALVALIAVTLPLAPGATAAPRAPGEENRFTVRVYACLADPGAVGIGIVDDPVNCRRVDYAVVSLVTSDGQRLGRCVTALGQSGAGDCVVFAPRGAQVIATLDPAALPEQYAGYLPLANPLTGYAYSDYAGVVFVLLPPAPPVPAPAA